MIEESRIRINGRVAVLGDQVTDADVVTVDGRVVSHRPPSVYLAYHKPVGVTCTTESTGPGTSGTPAAIPSRSSPSGAWTRAPRAWSCSPTAATSATASSGPSFGPS